MMMDLASRAILGADEASISLLAALGCTSRKPRAVFLMLHSVGGLAEAPYIVRGGVPSLSVERFKALLDFFVRRGFRTRTASEFAAERAAGRLEPRTLVLTFDDGFRDNYTLAAELLLDRGMKATFYPVCGWIGREQPAWLHRAEYYLEQDAGAFAAGVRAAAGARWTRFWTLFRSSGSPARDARLMFRQGLRPQEQREVLARLAARCGHPPSGRLYMNWRELASLDHAGMEIGAHTVTHRSLWTLEPRTAEREIVRAKHILHRRLQITVRSLAYPYGHYLPEHSRIAASAGYTNAVTVRPHHNDTTSDPFELGRYGITERSARRNHLCRISLDRMESPITRLNRRLGRNLNRRWPDPDVGIVIHTPDGLAYDTAGAAVVLQVDGA